MNARSVAHRLVVAVAATAVGVLGLAAPARAAQPFDWPNVTIDLPWTTATLLDGTACPGGRIRFRGLGEVSPNVGEAHRGDLTYTVFVRSTADVTGDGRADTVIRFMCSNQVGVGTGWHYLYTVARHRPVLLDYITSSDEYGNPQWLVLSIGARRGAVDVTQAVPAASGVADRTFTWTGNELVADRPLPIYPEADTAP